MSDEKCLDWEGLINFFQVINKLKRTKRYLSEPSKLNESVADHCWRLSLIVSLVSDFLDLKIDRVYAMRLALIHDLGEVIDGDIDLRKLVSGEVRYEDKLELEKKAWGELRKYLPEKVGQDFFSMWLDFEEQNSLEAKLVVALDRMEGALHICEIGCIHHSQPEIIPNSADKLVKEIPELLNFLQVVKSLQKNDFEQSGIPWKEEYDLLKED